MGVNDLPEKDWMELLSGQNQIQKVMELNRKTERFGLSLTEEEAGMLKRTAESRIRGNNFIQDN